MTETFEQVNHQDRVERLSIADLVSHFTEMQRQDEAVRRRVGELSKSKKADEERLTQIQEQVAAKERLRAEASQEGMDTSPLDTQIRGLRTEVEKTEAKVAADGLEYEQLSVGMKRRRKPDWFKYKIATLETLNSIGIAEIFTIDDPKQFAFVPAVRSVIRVDLGATAEDVKLRGFKLWIRGIELGCIPTAHSEERYVPEAVPEAIDWMGTQPATDQYGGRGWFRWEEHYRRPDEAEFNPYQLRDEEAGDAVAVFDYSTSRLYLDHAHRVKLIAEFKGVETEVRHEPTGPFDWQHEVICLEELLFELLVAECTELSEGRDVSAISSALPLLQHIRCEVLSRTQKEVAYLATAAPLNSKATFEQIKSDWLRFVQAPWSSEVRGPLAKLKYLSENGERARFWCEEIANHYGFRLRTRDHTWLIGRLFVDTRIGEPKDQPEIEIPMNGYGEPFGYRAGPQAIVGRLRIAVAESSG